MSGELPPELRAELLDDFHAEADEHLGSIRTQLTLLEAQLGRAAPEPAALESIFRSAHSLKGICAMVGLHAAEQLAHAAEDFLRQLTRHRTPLTAHGFDILIAAAQRLEQIVSAHRLHQPLPSAGKLVQELAHLAASPAPTRGETTAPTDRNRIADLSARGLAPWRCTFRPSRELDQRGVNINTLRARLGAMGEIVSATPSVGAGGSITFEFIVGLREPPAEPEAWARDGVEFAPIAAPARDPAAPAGEHSPSLFISPSHIVRVDLGRLDELMRITGELFIHRSRLEDRLAQAGATANELRDVSSAMARSLRQLRHAITRVRLVPIAEIFTRMPLVVRDLARETGKQARLVVEGQQTQIDKYLVERLKEPLLHLVRNAFSHGVEPADERLAAGKAAEATIQLRATTAGEFVHIEVRDDGRGIDPAAVTARATALGLSVPPQLDPIALVHLLCTPGFSTREEADRAAGRGVGMAVVRDTVRELGGTLTLDSTPGEGTRFLLRLPLTLSIAETIIVTAGPHTCAVPQGFVDEVIQVAETAVRTVKSTEVVPYRDGVLPLLRLPAMFGDHAKRRPQLSILVLSSERGSTGLVVDRVHAPREIVVRPMRDPLLQVPGVSGATELGDGRPVLILDPIAITDGVVRPRAGAHLTAARAPA